MNPEQLLDQAALAIQKVNASNSNMFIVGFKHSQIVCVPKYECQSLDIEFGHYTASTILLGLSTKEWDRLSDKIASFYFQKGLL